MDKKQRLYSGPARVLSVILCGLFGAGFLCFAMLSVIVRFTGYHGLSHDEMKDEALFRISTVNMASLMNRLTIGYYPQEIDSNDIDDFLKENWDSAIRDYKNVKNTDFAVIISDKENINELDLDDDRIYYYKSPGYISGGDYLFGKVFYTYYSYSVNAPLEVVIDTYPAYPSIYMDSEPTEKKLYVYILYTPVKEPVSNGYSYELYDPYDYYDAMSGDAKLMSLIDFFHSIDGAGIPMAIICFVGGIVCFVIITMSAGHKKGKDGIVLSWFDRIPFEITGFVLALAEMLPVSCLVQISEILTRELWRVVSVGDIVYIYFTAFFILILIPLILYETVVARIKAKRFIKNTITGKLVIFIVNKIRSFSGWIVTHTSVAKRIIICLPAVCIISILEAAIIQDSGMGFTFLFLAARVIEIAVILYLVYGYTKLREGASRIAAGNLDEPVNEKHLYPDFRLFARDLNNAGESIQLAVDEKLKSEKLKTQLITNVSHDIKTPLTSIINYVDLMQKEDIAEEEKAEYLDILAKQSERLKKLIQDLIDASKASSGAVEVDLKSTDICTLLRQVTGEYYDKFEEKNLTLVSKVSEESCIVKADSNLLWRVMDNLFINAYKYAMPGTRVYTEINKDESGTVSLSISNISKEPLGISEEELMERFVRGDASRNTEGSGLGLSIAKSLMELMNGSLSIKIDGDMFKAVLKM